MCKYSNAIIYFMKGHRRGNNMLQLMIFVLSCFALVQCQMPTLQISPHLTKLPILEGDELKLDCVHTYRSASTSEMASFKKGDIDIMVGNTDGFVITTTSTISQSDQGVTITTMTLKKNITFANDQAVYTCFIMTPQKLSRIEVYIVKITPHTAFFLESGFMLESRPVALYYEVMGWLENFKVNWKGINGQDLVDGDKYRTFINGTLIINNPNWDDVGEYKCTVTFNPSSKWEKWVITPQPVVLYGGPKILSKDKYEGTILELQCKARGFPKPTMKWYKDGKELNTTVWLHFSDYEGIANGKLIIFDPTENDAGKYLCVAGSDVVPFDTQNGWYFYVTAMTTTTRQMHTTAQQETRDFSSTAFIVPASIASVLGLVVVILVIHICVARRKHRSSTYEHNVAESSAPTTETPERVLLQAVKTHA